MIFCIHNLLRIHLAPLQRGGGAGRHQGRRACDPRQSRGAQRRPARASSRLFTGEVAPPPGQPAAAAARPGATRGQFPGVAPDRRRRVGGERGVRARPRRVGLRNGRGRAVQVEAMKPMFTVRGSKRSPLKYDITAFKVGFQFQHAPLPRGGQRGVADERRGLRGARVAGAGQAGGDHHITVTSLTARGFPCIIQHPDHAAISTAFSTLVFESIKYLYATYVRRAPRCFTW